MPASPSANTSRLRFLFNWTSVVGLSLAAAVVVLVVVVAAISSFASTEQAYIGLVYILAFAAGGVGVAIAALGAFRHWRREGRGEPTRPLTVSMDLAIARDRAMALGVLVAALLGLVALSTTSYQSVKYVESNDFCTAQCHSVMHPQGIADEASPHSRVDCVVCHVGDGAAGFVESKLRGVEQLKNMLTGDYPKPLATPTASLRPARDTCEQCHARERFIGLKERLYTYHGSEDGTEINRLRLLVKIGGGASSLMEGSGIHFHMTEGRKVSFIAADANKQDILWVKLENGAADRVFSRKGKPLSDAQRASLPVHEMDCLDCHNRPAHRFEPPAKLVNEAMTDGRIPTTIPGIKARAISLMSGKYETTTAAVAAISTGLEDHYRTKEADFYAANAPLVAQASEAIQGLFRKSQFPEMGVRWSAYPNNLGHRDAPGCFRCHNDGLVDAQGTPIFDSCTGCHVVLAQGAREGAVDVDYQQGQAFYHVVDEESLEEYTECVECHDGGDGIY